MVSALIIPRSATMQTRPMEKRWRRRSTTGTKLPVSAVLPGHISVHTGRPSPSMSTARIIWRKSGRRGYSKDPRPDLRQMILAVLLDGDGRPVCTEMWPGNTADRGSLVPVVDRLRQRFSIGRVCIIADRGMISAETIAELEARGLFYILGVRERTDKLVRELVLDDPGPFVPLAITKRGKSVNYEAKAVALAGRRYIVCRNHEEAKKDAADRASILAALERQLKKGDKALVGNGGYRRFLATTGENGFVIDRAKAEEDARFDGIFVLRTNTDIAPLDVMLCYKQLTMVEQIFRTAKSLFATRPIFHKLDETIRGHVSCSFLALVLKKALEDRIADLGKLGSWPEILADLDSLTETEVEQDNKRFLLRSARAGKDDRAAVGAADAPCPRSTSPPANNVGQRTAWAYGRVRSYRGAGPAQGG